MVKVGDTESSNLLDDAKSKGVGKAAKELGSAAWDKSKEEATRLRKFLMEGPAILKGYCFVTCCACLVVAIFQMFGDLINPFAFIVSLYAALFALIGMILEGTYLICTKGIRARIEYWLRLLARAWGRGLFYLLVAGMQFAQGSVGGYLVGIALIF